LYIASGPVTGPIVIRFHSDGNLVDQYERGFHLAYELLETCYGEDPLITRSDVDSADAVTAAAPAAPAAPSSIAAEFGGSIPSAPGVVESGVNKGGDSERYDNDALIAGGASDTTQRTVP
jgi:hypothetical protein